MKKIIYTILSITMFTACKKESSNPITNTTNTTPTKNINFSSIGIPIGKFGNGVSDIDGNNYKTVIIGKQEWMAENLTVTKYNDGTSITNMADSSKWNTASTGGWCYYNNDASNNSFGKLYNWYTLVDFKVCPTGWHVPNNTEWDTLFKYLGNDSSLGNKLIETGTTNWINPSNGNNTSLFTALPAGGRNDRSGDGGSASFVMKGLSTVFLSTSELPNSGINGVSHAGIYAGKVFFKTNDGKRGGYSIRCLKD